MTSKTDTFITLLNAPAQRAQMHSGIPASFTLAQAGLETGWSVEDAPGHNLFGIKADSAWLKAKGETVSVSTHEDENGKLIPLRALFRAYPDWQASIEDHSRFFYDNPRYHDALIHLDDWMAFVKAIAAAGYATDPDYAHKLTSIINQHQLYNFDVPRDQWMLLPWATVP